AAAISGTAAFSATPRCEWRKTVCRVGRKTHRRRPAVSRWVLRPTLRHTTKHSGEERIMDLIVGIDLGTTNSEVAMVRDGQPHVFAEDGDPILPSFVGLAEDGRLLVGKAAKNQWVLAPERTIKSIKRKMGQDVKIALGDQDYRPQEISAMILRVLRERAARQLGVPVR